MLNALSYFLATKYVNATDFFRQRTTSEESKPFRENHINTCSSEKGMYWLVLSKLLIFLLHVIVLIKEYTVPKWNFHQLFSKKLASANPFVLILIMFFLLTLCSKRTIML